MNASIVGIARRPDRAAAIALLEGANLPTTDLTDEHLEQFFFLGPRAAPFGLIGLELCGRHALLRSLVVAPDNRAAGSGSTLVAHAEEYARTRGVALIYLLTTTAEDFFLRRGYGRIERSEAPDSIRSTREFSGICPTTSIFMVKHL